MILAAGVVAYLQRTEPQLLQSTAPDTDSSTVQWVSLRPFWLALGVLMILTPLGLVAAGSAWGEWSVQQFPDPAGVPTGLMRLSSIWTAPFPAYAPPFLKSASFGYMLSAMVGTGLVILATLLITGWIARRSQ
jgi:cobalt/nickel transport system permease protein